MSIYLLIIVTELVALKSGFVIASVKSQQEFWRIMFMLQFFIHHFFFLVKG